MIDWLIETWDVLKSLSTLGGDTHVMINRNMRCIEIDANKDVAIESTGLIETWDVLKFVSEPYYSI